MKYPQFPEDDLAELIDEIPGLYDIEDLLSKAEERGEITLADKLIEVDGGKFLCRAHIGVILKTNQGPRGIKQTSIGGPGDTPEMAEHIAQKQLIGALRDSFKNKYHDSYDEGLNRSTLKYDSVLDEWEVLEN